MTAPYVTDYSTQKTPAPVPTDTRNLIRPANYYQSPEYAKYLASNNTWNVTSYFNFQCYLLLMDDTNKILTKLILVDTDETFAIVNRVDMNRTAYNSFAEQNISSYIDNNKERLIPPAKTLYEIAEKKILALKE